MAFGTLFVVLNLAVAAAGGSLADVKHLVMIMFENRSFDHYFGTMAGVRGFADPNVQVNPSTGLNTFQQLVDSRLSTSTNVLLPWEADYEGGTWTDAAQCMYGGSNAWTENHAALNSDLNDHWALNNTPHSLMYYRRDIVPVHFGIAESFTVADMYQQSVVACTNPNRVMWMSGSVNVPGGLQTSDDGGTLLQNSCTDTCDIVDPPIDCCPLKWKAAGEYLQDAGVPWRLYQDDYDVAGQDLFAQFFESFLDSKPGDPLYYNGVGYFDNNTLDAFVADAMNGTLPAVSWLIPQQALSEHPPWTPDNGAWLQKWLVDAVTQGDSWNDTVFIISYDEEGGWYDHVTPYHSPAGTAGEWMTDPYGDFGQVYAGPGSRLPFYIISPWTRGGRVFTEHADHTSQLLFMEKFLQANGYDNFKIDEISDWRREHMSNLVNAFDFDNPDYSQPTIPDIQVPTQDSDGNYIDVSTCKAAYPNLPTVPYGIQAPPEELAGVVEHGFKEMRGSLTEGRFVVFEANGFALANPNTTVANGTTTALTATPATADHADVLQRWVVHQLDIAGNSATFNISSAAGGSWLGSNSSLSGNLADAQAYTVSFSGGTYTLQNTNGEYLAITSGGDLVAQEEADGAGYKLYAVTYYSGEVTTPEVKVSSATRRY